MKATLPHFTPVTLCNGLSQVEGCVARESPVIWKINGKPVSPITPTQLSTHRSGACAHETTGNEQTNTITVRSVSPIVFNGAMTMHIFFIQIKV